MYGGEQNRKYSHSSESEGTPLTNYTLVNLMVCARNSKQEIQEKSHSLFRPPHLVEDPLHSISQKPAEKLPSHSFMPGTHRVPKDVMKETSTELDIMNTQKQPIIRYQTNTGSHLPNFSMDCRILGIAAAPITAGIDLL